MSRYELTRYASSRDLTTDVASRCVSLIASHESTPLFSIALSGGRIAGALFEAMTNEVMGHKVSLSKVHFFWADERCVPLDHPDSNYAIAHAKLFAPLGVSPEHVHRIKGELPPGDAAADATREVLGIVPPQNAVSALDLILLGMGEDGHVASLFPGSPACGAGNDIYCHVRGPKPPPDRITMSYAMLSAARDVFVLVSGAGKEEALRQSLNGAGATPLGRVIASRFRTLIFAEGQ
jgi:6-phosphogluconolactonase